MTLLRMVDVGLRFPDGTEALQGMDLSVAAGQFVAVVGPSGCGKSTLLRLAAGLAAPSSGEVHRGADELAYVFQDPALLPWRTVRSNVELAAELRGLSKAERRDRATQALELVGLTEFAGHRPGALSGGMRMRASLARSLTLRPDLFLFDEPFGALDEISRERLGDEVARLFGERGFGAVFVTHSVTEAVFLSTRVIVLSERPGRVLGDFPVPFDYPRPPRLRFDERFAHLAGKVSECLRGGVQ
ncbi:ABC transporter ATP-binding protein [Kutzneria sp. NPDC052558]|uniref:ABC transporter ATP-binding protein n=1 Tax=Kutzneria sp. NPDC052558 TaxID=3364121 RepID=UPI0037CB3FBD